MMDNIEAMTPQTDQQELAEQLVEQARADGVELIGPGGMLTGLTSKVINTALEVEMAEHLGYDKHDPAGRNGENSRNGKRTKTVLTELGPVPVDVPRDRDGSSRVFTAPNAEAAALRFAEFPETWGGKYPAIITLRRNAWEEFIPFLDYDVEIRRVICSTNAIESLNARYRRAVRARGYFPTEQAALKCLLDRAKPDRSRQRSIGVPTPTSFVATTRREGQPDGSSPRADRYIHSQQQKLRRLRG